MRRPIPDYRLTPVETALFALTAIFGIWALMQAGGFLL